MQDALARLGGVAPSDTWLLRGEDAGALAQALDEADAAARAARAEGRRAELFFYYSGHAKDGELRLGDSRFPMEGLKRRLAGAQADVRVAVLDACRSGAIVRSKGARLAPAFEVDAGPRAAQGLVILTSSSNDEESQESDQIMGSFFTHALVSGMLGEADSSRDGRVTLAEAYAYAYDRTLAGTAETAAGAQHPTFSFDLSGHGDVILTEVGPAPSRLVLPAALEGSWVLLERGGRAVAAEVIKEAGVERSLALAPGAYLVRGRAPDHLWVGEIEVPERGSARLDAGALAAVPFEDDPVKGAARPRPHLAAAAAGGYQIFLSSDARERYFPGVALWGVDAELRDYLRPGWSVGLDAAAGQASGALSVEGRRFAYDFSQVTVGASVLVEPWGGALRPVFGARLAYVSMRRGFPGEPALEEQRLSTTAPGLVLGLSWSLSPRVSAFARARGSWLIYSADEDRSLAFADGAAGLRLGF